MPVVPYVRATHSDGQSWSAAKANVLEAGVTDVSYAPAVRAYHNAAQAITTATWTSLALNSERFDQAGNAAATMHDLVTNNSRLTCKYAGVYWIHGEAVFEANATGVQRTSRIFMNATTVIADGNHGILHATEGGRTQVNALYALAVNDY